jgi:hypothetical protein
MFRIWVHFILSVDGLDYFDSSLRRYHIPKPICSQDETSVARDIDCHCVDVWFGWNDKLVRSGIKAPQVAFNNNKLIKLVKLLCFYNSRLSTKWSSHCQERDFVNVCGPQNRALMTNLWSVPYDTWNSSFPNHFATSLLNSANLHCWLWFVILCQRTSIPNTRIWVLKIPRVGWKGNFAVFY